jgi:hypothetical protein
MADASAPSARQKFVETGRKLKRSMKKLSMPVTWLMLAGALALVLSAVPLVFLMVDGTTPAFIRAASFLPVGFYGFSLVSMYIKPLYVYPWPLLVSGAVSLITLFASWLFEVKRWSRCNGISSADSTDVENGICLNYSGQVWVAPALISVAFFACVGSFIYVLFITKTIETTSHNLRILFKQEKKALASNGETTEAEKINGAPRVPIDGIDYAQFIFNALLAAALLFVAGTALFRLNAAAFYRAPFLMPAAMLVGSHLAMWRTPVKYWRWIVAAFAALTVVAAIWGMTIEFGRYANCLADPKTPYTTTEAFICDEEGWLVGVVPFTLLGAAVAGLVNLALLIARLATGNPKQP